MLLKYPTKRENQASARVRQPTKYLAGLVLNKNVVVKDYGQDRYGGTLGVVFLAGKNVNPEMI
jgi:endonuclease YncB( thermonuclease family)